MGIPPLSSNPPTPFPFRIKCYSLSPLRGALSWLLLVTTYDTSNIKQIPNWKEHIPERNHLFAGIEKWLDAGLEEDFEDDPESTYDNEINVEVEAEDDDDDDGSETQMEE